jgi:hypothetical protein
VLGFDIKGSAKLFGLNAFQQGLPELTLTRNGNGFISGKTPSLGAAV